MKSFNLLEKILLVGVAVVVGVLFFWEFQLFGLLFFALLSLTGIVLVLYVLLFAVLGIITYAALKFPKEPAVEPIDLSTARLKDWANIEGVTKEIQELGFSQEGDFKLQFTTKHESYARAFLDDSKTILAQLIYTESYRAKILLLAFVTSFEDETAVETMNYSHSGALGIPRYVTAYYHPEYSAEELFTQHKEHVEALKGKNVKKISEGLQETLLHDIKKTLDAQVDLGIFQKNTAGEYYRYTWHGAFSAVAMPMKSALKFWGKKKGEKDKRFGLKTGISQFFLVAFFVAVTIGIYFKMTGSTTFFPTLLMVIGSFGILIVYGGVFMQVENKWLRRAKNAVLALLIVLGVIVISGAISQQTFLYLLQEPIMLEEIAAAPEARAWLGSNNNPSAFASNRFFTTENALTFVNTLYNAGAKEVLVHNVFEEEWRIQEEGGPYADALIVKLPMESAQRDLLFDLAARESIRKGFAPEIDQGQEYIYLWWN